MFLRKQDLPSLCLFIGKKYPNWGEGRRKLSTFQMKYHENSKETKIAKGGGKNKPQIQFGLNGLTSQVNLNE